MTDMGAVVPANDPCLIPLILAKRKQWLVWRFEKYPGDKKPRKVPYYGNGQKRRGKQGSPEDRAALVNLDQAFEVMSGGRYSGVGFVFLQDDGLVGVDLDDSIGEGGEIREDHLAILNAIPTYTEFSPSGRGFHLIADTGDLKGLKSRKDHSRGVELFAGNGFFTFTANIWNDRNEVNAAPGDLRSILGMEEAQSLPARADPGPVPQRRNSLDDARAMLDHISPDLGYEEWIKVGQILHDEFGGMGDALWIDWSKQSNKFPGENRLQSHIRSFGTGGVKATLGSLVHMAKAAGWQPPRRKSSSAPPVLESPPVEAYTGSDSPHPSGDEVPPEISLEDALKRFALISGTTKIWDRYQKQRLTSAAFSMAIGAAVAKEWKASGAKRQILERDVRSLLAEAQASAQGRGGVSEALERFVYLSVSSTAWDHQRRQVTRLDDIKHEIPEVYDFWYRHPKRKCVDKDNLVFDPTQSADPKTHINMFRGLPLKPDFDDSKCEHIRKMFWRLCNCDETVWRWLAQWLAYPLQNVGAKMATAVLMHSEVHGSGKSLLFDGVMRPIYGDYGATLGQHQMESQYTDWQSNLLYGLFEEIFSREKKYSQTGTVKQMITSTTTRIEKKFVSGWEEANHINCIFLSNELQPFPVEPSDRRFLVIWPNWKLEDELQKAVAAELENGGVESFFGWLLSLPLGDFGRHTKPPMTAAKQRLIDFGRPSWDVFYEEWINGSTDAPYHTCLTRDLYNVYKRWCKQGSETLMARNRFSEAVAGRVRKQSKMEYDEPGGYGKPAKKSVNGTFFLVHEKPDEQTQKEWLSSCVVNFRRSLGADEEDYG